VAIATDARSSRQKRADFQRVRHVSSEYAAQELMPEVLEVGDDFQGTRCPYIRERYVPGLNLAAAYLTAPEFWDRRVAQELIRIYRAIAGMGTYDVTDSWREKLAGVATVAGYEEVRDAIVRAGHFLLEQHPRGHRIHGDLQFGNIVARRDGDAAHLTLIDWEMSEVMPLGYEFAMLYTFLLDPAPQLEEPLRPNYRAATPLRRFWSAVAPALHTELGIGEAELKQLVLFRMGNAWLHRLDRALRDGDERTARRFEQKIDDLISGVCFTALPYPTHPTHVDQPK
jgi:hypothetical protein